MDVIVADLVDKRLSKDGLRSIAKAMVALAEKRLPGQTGPEKLAWCVDKVTCVLESFDDKLPVIGAFMDLPFVDGFERWAIKQVVEWAWASLQAEKTKATQPI